MFFFFSGLLNIVPVKEAAAQIISNMRRRHAIVFLPPIYYYIQVIDMNDVTRI